MNSNLGIRAGFGNIDIYRNKLTWKKIKKPVNTEFYGPLGLLVTLIRRDDKIRTCDPLHPMQVRYRAALRPELYNRLTCWSILPCWEHPFGSFKGCKSKGNILFNRKNLDK